MRFSKKIVVAIIAMNVLFAVSVLVVFWHTGTEPQALVASWFAFTTGELWALAKIKREEVKDNDDDNKLD